MAQRWIFIVGISAIFFGYLFHVPNSEGVPQINRIRLLSASMKLVHFVGFICERLGLAPAWYIQRQSGSLLKKLKATEINPDLTIKETIIEGVPLRIYIPKKTNDNEKKLRPAIVFYHGGAFYMGSIETHHPITRDLARQTGFIVLSVEYRLAPEHPFPAGLDDCLKVTQHVLDQSNAERLGIDVKRVAIAGDSAGGNLAAVISQRFSSHSISRHNPRLQILIYPVVEFFDQMVPSYLTPTLQIFHFGRAGQVLEMYLNKSISDDILVNNHTSQDQKKKFRPWVDWSFIPEKYRQVYRKPMGDHLHGNPRLIENARQALEPDVSPLLVDDQQLAKLPLTYILTVGHDRLRDQGFIYAGRLKRAGVNVLHQHYENTFHGSLTFLDGPFELQIAHQMLDDIVKYLKENL